MNLGKMAWRNVFRNRRRTAVTVGAMAFALTAELIYAGMLPGLLEGMEQDIVEMEMGDVQLHADKYLERPSLYESIDKSEELLAALDKAGLPAAPRLMSGGLMAAGENSAGVGFRGVEVSRDSRVSEIGNRVAKGEWLDPGDADGVVIGKGLARTLGVKPGDELVVLTQASDGSMANELFNVRGVLQSVAQGVDRTVVYMNAQTFRDLLVFPAGAHQILIRKPEGTSSAELSAAVSDIVAAYPGVDAKTWRELQPVLGTMLESSRSLLSVILVIFYVAVAILVLNAMLMAVFERVREFGVLKAIGTGPGRVFLMILMESFLQAMIAFVIGFAVAAPGMWYLSKYGINVGTLGGVDMMGVAVPPVWYGVYRPDVIVMPVMLLFLIVFVAVLYPAIKAALIRPIDAIHHQ